MRNAALLLLLAAAPAFGEGETCGENVKGKAVPKSVAEADAAIARVSRDFTQASVMNVALSNDTAAYGFPKMDASYLNQFLSDALKSLGCKVSKHLGVQGDTRHQTERPGSCHNVGRAIDIATLKCANKKTNEENLRALAGKFKLNPFVLVCYKDIGLTCTAGHGNHLHFGAREFLWCRTPWG